jgi:hypothetical protein
MNSDELVADVSSVIVKQFFTEFCGVLSFDTKNVTTGSTHPRCNFCLFQCIDLGNLVAYITPMVFEECTGFGNSSSPFCLNRGRLQPCQLPSRLVLLWMLTYNTAVWLDSFKLQLKGVFKSVNNEALNNNSSVGVSLIGEPSKLH